MLLARGKLATCDETSTQVSQWLLHAKLGSLSGTSVASYSARCLARLAMHLASNEDTPEVPWLIRYTTFLHTDWAPFHDGEDPRVWVACAWSTHGGQRVPTQSLQK